MIKKYLKTLIITSIMDLSPIIIGIILWDRLPDKIATHFGVDNTPDGWSSKAVAVFGLPVVLFALEWLCMLATKLDPKYRNIDDSVMMKIVLWMMPCLSIMMSTITYTYALGKEIKVGFIVLLFMVLEILLVIYLWVLWKQLNLNLLKVLTLTQQITQLLKFLILLVMQVVTLI